MVILRAISFLKGHKSDTRMTSRITLVINHGSDATCYGDKTVIEFLPIVY
jgi:hypothetical protein